MEIIKLRHRGMKPALVSRSCRFQPVTLHRNPGRVSLHKYCRVLGLGSGEAKMEGGLGFLFFFVPLIPNLCF